MTKQELIDRINTVEDTGLTITGQWHSIFSEGIRYFFSSQDVGLRKHKDWEYIVMNYIFPTAVQEAAKLAKNNPKIYTHPFGDEDIEAAQTWQGATQWQWENPLRMRMLQIAKILCGKIFGYSVTKIYWMNKKRWNDRNKSWEGDVCARLWHPCHFWADGREDINEGNCGSVRWVVLEEAQAMWPKYAKKFEAIAISSRDEEFRRDYGTLNFRSSTASDGTHKDYDRPKSEYEATLLLDMIENSNRIPEDDRKYVRISECYLKDSDERHVVDEEPLREEELLLMGYTRDDNMQVIDPEGQVVTEWPSRVVAEYDEPVFPFGRMVISAGCGTERVILNEKEQEQVYPFDRWPFVVQVHYPLPFMWQGMNAVTLYKSTQDMINVTMSHMVNNLKQFGDPRVIAEEGALAVHPKTKKPFSISSAAGSVIRLARGAMGRFQVQPPIPVSPAAASLFNVFVQEFRNITGLQGIAQGQKLEGDVTATEAQYLAISSNDRIYLQSVYEDQWVKDTASLIAGNMQTYYDVGRWIRIVGEDDMIGITQITNREKEVMYDIIVEAGTTLPFDKEKRTLNYEKAYQLMSNPVANPMLPEMLRVLEIPNWKKMIDEMPAYQKYLMFVQLYQGVKEGKIPPEQAVMALVKAAQQEFASESMPMQ